MRYTFTAAQLEQAREITEDCTFSDVEVRTTYSGRGMFGDTCVGIVLHETANVMLFIASLFEQSGRPADEAVDFFAEFASRQRVDNMGREFIVYWPSLQVSPE